MYKLQIHFSSHSQQLYLSNKMKPLVIKVAVVYIGICASRCLKEELAKATGQWLQIIM